MTPLEEASKAFERGDLDRVRAVLEPPAMTGDLELMTALGSYLVHMPGSFVEGVAWLNKAADAGSGHAAHNLATALAVGGDGVQPDRSMAAKWMQVAVDSGFEASVSSDPLWWRPAGAG